MMSLRGGIADEAIQNNGIIALPVDCFASLAMTAYSGIRAELQNKRSKVPSRYCAGSTMVPCSRR
jgi:hypothetical protein